MSTKEKMTRATYNQLCAQYRELGVRLANAVIVKEPVAAPIPVAKQEKIKISSTEHQKIRFQLQTIEARLADKEKLTDAEYEQLCTQYDMLDAVMQNYKVVESYEKIERHFELPPLSRQELERLIGQPLDNALIYFHVPVAGFKTGWNRDTYNGYPVSAQEAYRAYREAERRTPLGLLPQLTTNDTLFGCKLIATVSITYDYKKSSVLVTNPIYAPDGDSAATTVILYNPFLKQYERPPLWNKHSGYGKCGNKKVSLYSPWGFHNSMHDCGGGGQYGMMFSLYDYNPRKIR